MRCEAARRDWSAALDGDPMPARTLAHLETCADCQSFARRLERLRLTTAGIRSEAPAAPDVAARVLARLPRKPPATRRGSMATGFALGALVGVVVAGGIGGTRTSLAVELPEAIVAAQTAIHRLTATFTVTESIDREARRTYIGRLSYRSPERLIIEVTQTDGPPDWAVNSWSMAIDGEIALVRTPFPCPTLGGCPEGEPRTRVTTGRDPFSVLVPAPLDAIVPSSILRNGPEPQRFAGGERLARPTVAFTVTAAQARSLLDAYFAVGNWREIHPTDIVAIWLDRDRYVPLRITISPGGSTDRALWASRRSYGDEPGTPYLIVDYLEVDLAGEGNLGGEVEPTLGAGREAQVVDAGFRTDLNLVPPVDPGIPLVAAGTIDGRVTTTVWAWSDGRAWIRLDLTDMWTGPGLFGNDGSGVRILDLPGGPIFASGSGGQVFVHGDGFDAMVSGSIESPALEDLAASLPGRRLALDANWPEAPAESGAVARAWLPVGLVGYSEPIIRAVGETVLVDLYAAGGRSVSIASQPESLLPPPLDPDARALPVRGGIGRYSPMLGLLEFTEDQTSLSVASPTASLEELLAIASSLSNPSGDRP